VVVAFYVRTMGTISRDSLTRQGYGKAVEHAPGSGPR
jgi:hypothetical protein